MDEKARLKNNLATKLLLYHSKWKDGRRQQQRRANFLRHRSISQIGGNFNMESTTDEMARLFVMNQLATNGICVIDNYLDDKTARKVALTTRQIYQYIPGLFNEALPRTGFKYRDDVTCWVKGSEEFCKSFSVLNRRIAKTVYGLYYDCKHSNKHFKISHKSRLQVACFPSGCHGYKPHFDNPDNNGRVLTVVYFPNEDYGFETHGAVSRFIVNEKLDCIDVSPIFNRLVLYWSDKRVIVETLPAYQDVFTLSCWYMGHEQPQPCR